MQPGFEFITKVNRWRNLAAKAKWNIKEEDAVQMVINNLHGPIKEAMVLGDFQTFLQLFERAARMQRSIKDGSITFLRNCSNGGQVTTQGPTPVQTNPGPSASANTIRACTAARREMPVRPPQVL
ncbi:hypothetical protein Acr_00g0002210 [Actinidia rufa]|nr:hypothetical protein Acr_00g0002210 [Actinidia rufa]